MRWGIGLMGVVQVVGRHQRQLQVLRDLEKIGTDPIFDAQSVVHQLDEVVARPNRSRNSAALAIAS